MYPVHFENGSLPTKIVCANTEREMLSLSTVFLNRRASHIQGENLSTWHVMWNAVTLLICVCHPRFHGHELQHECSEHIFGLLLRRL